ncbi:unnamed protein product, partial [Nesidiocoris tenuis]
MKKFATLNRKLVLARSRRWFLLKCRTGGVYPNHIMQNFNCVHNVARFSGGYAGQSQRLIKRFKRDLLNLEIRATIGSLHRLKKDMDNVRMWLRSNLPAALVDSFLAGQCRFGERFFDSQNLALNSKFRKLQREQTDRVKRANGAFLVNLTDVRVPPQVEGILGLSGTVNLPYNSKNLPIVDLITDVEMLVGGITDEEQRRAVRSEAATIIRNGISRYRNAPDSHLENSVRSARAFLREHPELILVRSDKGNSSVLMMKSDYDEKMDAMLDDEVVYRPQRANPTAGLQKKCNEMVDHLVTLGCVDKWKCDQYKTHNAVAPKIYGLPKCHKPNVPLRPIVSGIGSPGVQLSRLVKQLLVPLKALSSYDVVNSYAFQ